MDTPSQVWYFILQYLGSVESRNMDLSKCLNFLFQLSFAELGKVRLILKIPKDFLCLNHL